MPDTAPALFLGQPVAFLIGLGVIGALLAAGWAAALILPRREPGMWTDLKPRMQSWSLIVGILAAALLAGAGVFITLFALVSFIALKEFLTLAPTRKEDRIVLLLAYLAVPVTYLSVWADEYILFLVLVPVYLFTLMAFAMALGGRTEKYLATAGIVYWGVVVCVTNLGYVPLLMQVPLDEAGPAGPAGLVLFVLLVTQLNDVAQYAWGKSFGKRKILPTVSPNKTWEGAIGGGLTTAVVIIVLGPLVTPLDGLGLWLLAIGLPIAGFAGDVTMSAIKRDLGVKDTGTLLPGHGGALDRLDSLTFTAPLFFHILAFFAVAHF
ncbi:MAG: phosphatidate cytidylyltransferase [Hyphomonadaceae bacterium]|jgi:phosphatidate cytidylyltransferase|nr:phosphatidate cytidylyltransferase [Hyphomonadaceae bacterium]